MINYSTGNLVQLEKASSCRGLPRIYSSVTQPTRGPFKRVSHNSRLVLDGAFLDILISNRSRHDRVYIAASKQSALLRFLFDDLFRVRCAPSFSLSLSLSLSEWARPVYQVRSLALPITYRTTTAYNKKSIYIYMCNVDP